MIKAVFFDWFNTLAHFEPPREELYRRAFLDFGKDISLKTIYKGLQSGDRFFFSESAKLMVRRMSPEERAKQFVRYVQAISEESGFTLPAEVQMDIIRKVLVNYSNTYALFEDAGPLFQKLKSQNLIQGIITNADRNIENQIERLNIKGYLNVLVTSDRIGAEKPASPIFLAALEETGVKASEAIYIGDQYQSDILGARGVGMKAILIDRYEVTPEIQECPRIGSLSEVTDYL